MSSPRIPTSLIFAACLLATACGTARQPALPPTASPAEARLPLRAAILRAEDRRVVDDALRTAVEHSDPEIRRAAVRALGRTRGGDVRGILETALADDDANVAAEAATALGFLGDTAALPALHDAARGSSASLRAGAAFALGLLAEDASKPALAEMLSDDEGSVAAAACRAVARFDRGRFAVDGLMSLVDSSDAQVRFAALFALSRLSSRPGNLDLGSITRVRRKMLELSTADDPVVRMFVARALNVPSGDEQATVLGALSADSVPAVRIDAVRSFSFPGAPIQPFLSKTLVDEDDRVVLATVLGLARMRGIDVNEALARIVVNDPRLWLRVAATLAMAGADPDAGAAMASGISRDENPRLRKATASLLVGRVDDSSIEIARRLVADDDPGVRRAAIPGLAGVPEPLAEALGELAGAGDPSTRAAVARAAGLRLSLADRTAADRLATAELIESLWVDGGGPESAWANAAVLRAAVAAGGSPQARRLLERALASEWYHLRTQAARELARLFDDDRGLEIGAAADLPLEHYAEILRWAECPRAAVVTVERPGFVPGRFTVRLDTQSAPLTVWNFARLAEAGFYSGVELGHVLPNLLLQTGDPLGDGPGGPGPTLREEPAPHPFDAGTLAMASTGRDLADGRWFVTLSPQPQMSGRFTAFGVVVQNFAGVVARLLPGDRVVSVEVYEGDGTEPLPSESR